MAEQQELVAPTYREILKWDRETTRKNFADPKMRPLIDQVIAQHEEEVKASAQAAQQTTQEAEAARANRAQAAAEKHEAEQAALRAEAERVSKLSPKEILEESVARDKAAKEQERKDELAKVAREREAARLSTMRPEEIKAEQEAKEAAEAERLAKEEADRLAAEAQAKVDAEAAAAAEAARVEAERVAAEAAEAEKKAAEEAAKKAAEEAAKPKQKLVQDFQLVDDNGKPIGRRTRLVADTPEEMVEKLKECYANAMKYAERMKRRAAATVAPEPEVQIPAVLTNEQREAIEKDLESKDDAKKTLAQIKIEQDNINRGKREEWIKAENQRQTDETNKFFKARPDFYPCEANATEIQTYLKAKNLRWTAANLEEAFEVLEHRLAPRPTEVVEAPAAADAAAATAAVEAAQAAEAQKVQAEAEAKAKADAEAAARQKIEDEIRAKVLAEIETKKKLEQEQAAANTAAAQASVAPAAPAAGSTPTEKSATTANTVATAPKPPAGGIEPGTMHGGRPAPSTGDKAPVYTKQDIIRMPKEEMRRRMRNPAFVKIVNELFAPKK